MQELGFAVLMLLAASCVGCGSTERVPAPDVRINTAPHERLRLDISVAGQSALVEGMRGAFYYNIENKSCMPLDYSKALGGIYPSFTQMRPFVVAPAGVNGYEAILYRDMYESSDYYGLGVCRWELTGINIYIIRKDGKKQNANLHDVDLEYGAHSYATCPTGSPGQHSLNCAFSRSYPVEISGDFYTLSIISRKD